MKQSTSKAKATRRSLLSPRPPCDALQRILDTPAHNPKPLTHERAAELADAITGTYEDDKVTFALIELLEGIFEAAFHGGDYEGMVLQATHRAYANTAHFSQAFDEFASLDPNNPRDLRVLRRDFVDAEQQGDD